MGKPRGLLPFLTVAAVLVSLLALSSMGCGGGTLRMMGNDNPGFLEMVNGNPVGFSGELATYIAGRLGMKLEVTIEPFSELFTLLKSDACDMAMSAVTITAERKAQTDFSEPYFDSGQCILVQNASTIASPSDLAGRKVGVLKGSSNQKEAEKIGGTGQIVEFAEKPQMFGALVAGQLDAVIVDTPFAQYNVRQTGQTKIAKVLTTGDKYGIAVRKGNEKLLDDINKALGDSHKDGTYDRLYEKYFGKKI